MTDDELALVTFLRAMIAVQSQTIERLARRVDGQWAIIIEHERRLKQLERRVAVLEMTATKVEFSPN